MTSEYPFWHSNKFIYFIFSFQLEIFLMRLAYWDCKEHIFQINTCHPGIWFYNFENTQQRFHFEMLLLNKLIQIFYTTQKMKLSIKDFFSKGDQIGRKLRIWSHLLKKSLMKNFIFLCRIKIVLKVPSFFCLVNTADTKSPVSLDHSKMTPLPKRFLTSLVIISVSNMSCAILETF